MLNIGSENGTYALDKESEEKEEEKEEKEEEEEKETLAMTKKFLEHVNVESKMDAVQLFQIKPSLKKV